MLLRLGAFVEMPKLDIVSATLFLDDFASIGCPNIHVFVTDHKNNTFDRTVSVTNKDMALLPPCAQQTRAILHELTWSQISLRLLEHLYRVTHIAGAHAT
jgi:hypothetical protein